MTSRPFHKAFGASLLALVGLLGTSGVIAQICTREYAPVCGQVAGEPAPSTFANRCLMDASKAAFVSQGECAAHPPKNGRLSLAALQASPMSPANATNCACAKTNWTTLQPMRPTPPTPC